MEIGFLMPKNNISIDFGFLMPRKEIEQPPVSVYENSDSSNLCHRFTFAQIKAATNNFDEARVLGVGKCGKVYLGVTDGGKTKVAIKRRNKDSDLALQDFRTELEMLSKLPHPHLISLIGYCDEKAEMILVFDYVAHGSLRDHLYKTKSEPLAWTRRLEICIGVARGLHYLHAGGRDTIIHRDVKTTNILLDDKWVAKLSDFGLSKTTTDHAPVSTCARGTLEYIDPEYVRRSRLTEKSDVYSFGVVLCEILSAQPITGLKIEDRHVSLVEWALDCHKTGVLDQILDPNLKGKISAESFMKVAETAVKCLADCGIDRPSMVDVLLDLEYALALHERPLKGTSKDFDENLMASTSNTSISSLKKSSDENLMASTSNASISSLSSLSSEDSDGSDTSVV
ncbi:putative protein kinase RLK-Pelle-CrRLK1L-1 family [Helianthus annuus]|nr:putative protein kinase RLK-Pelle-CrRLK1L-1 family [Helianthus annuus]